MRNGRGHAGIGDHLLRFEHATRQQTDTDRIAARRISPAVIAELDIPAHTRRILSTLVNLATLPANTAMAAWLHTLGYRGHITSKSRRYSITMTALRAHRRGGPEVLVVESAPVPRPAAGEVLIAVHAAAITFDELTWNET